ncbi:MAG: hypothetical protein GXO79_13865 [Chlorobi bacterium]|nr:hypothetical protein [Chlorobiota bacterium]
MDEQKIFWKKQTLVFDSSMKDALQQQHYAAQFIALVGRHLIQQQADDSNTNMQFLKKEEMLVGNELSNGLRVALHLPNMKLLVLNKGYKTLQEILLLGKTQNQAFNELRKSLEDNNVDISKLTNELHYEIPEHALAKGAVFKIEDKKYTEENSIYRNNADIIINEVAAQFKNADPVRVWPHHFDTGFFYPVAKNEKGELSKSIGIGWAIADSMINEPYYYLSFWSEKPVNNSQNFNSLKAGQWMMPIWDGAVLKNSDILNAGSAENQYKLVKTFFNSGINILKNNFEL